MKTAKLKNGLICISVPMDATDFHKSNHAIGFKSNNWKHDRDCNNLCYVSFGLGGAINLQILGTITTNECSFDLTLIYGKVKGCNCNECFLWVKEMIEAETNFLFENPMGNEPIIDEPNIHSQYYASQIYNHAEWQKYQSRVIEKLLIIKPI